MLLAALAAGALALGVARSDLAALFWGSSFLLAAIYATVGSLAMRRLLARRQASNPSFLMVTLPTGRLRTGDIAEARISSSMPRLYLPGFAVRVVVRPAWRGRCLGPITTALHPGDGRATVSFRAARRGAYQARAAELEITDVLGLSRLSLGAPIQESVRVLPRAAPRRPPERESGEGGDAPRYERHRRRNEELLEVREYVPGDDVRRLNWKLLAHAGEPFLRIGEETPPPRSRVLVVLDTGRPSAIAPCRSEELLDLLVEDCASAAAALLARGVELVAVRPGDHGCGTVTSESQGVLLAWLAEAWWSDPDAALELPPTTRSTRALVFTTPGSPGLDRILAGLKARRCRTALLVSELAPPRRPGRRSLRDLVFLPAPSSEERSA